ncbi:gfo/Idh/MocA family oxidoreductase, partial [bacterium]|nr:gfo/Idh/MocA family oxidoreductase [bacterium]
MPGERTNQTRRDFLRAAGAMAAAPYVLTSTALGAPDKAAASDRITMGAIGIGGRGRGNMTGFARRGEVQMIAVCDVVKGKRDGAKSQIDGHNKNTNCTPYNDFRDLVARKD